MEFKYHVLTGILVPGFLYFYFDIPILAAVTISLASVLIDIDHYFWYAAESKDLNPFNAISWYIRSSPKIKKMPSKKRKEYTKGVFIFHNWICWSILLALGFLNQIFFYTLVGFVIHIIPDLVVLKKIDESILQKISLGYVLKRNKNKKRITDL
ncbi:MAG: hypothetical protein IH845_00365 [Nanoarchaeota archaeon]|nr:hypothetical protein [Nanoarchaeota archaeon]